MARLIDRFNAMVRGDGPGAPEGRLIGFLCDVADAAMGTAYASINFLRPFWSGRLVATARTVKTGRTIGLVECDVPDADERLVARAMSTCMTLRGDSREGR